MTAMKEAKIRKVSVHVVFTEPWSEGRTLVHCIVDGKNNICSVIVNGPVNSGPNWAVLTNTGTKNRQGKTRYDLKGFEPRKF